MKLFVLILSLSVGLTGCATLTKTQIEAVNQFAQTSKNFSAYPSAIVTNLAEVRLKRSMYYSITIDSAKVHLADLDSIYTSYNKSIAVSDKVNITFKVIDKYAQALLLLSSDKHTASLKTEAGQFGTDLDSLVTIYNSLSGTTKVPSGFGGAVNKLIVMGGSQYIRTKQAKEIKKFVPKADTLIAVMCNNLLEYLNSSKIGTLIDNEEAQVRSSYLSYLRHGHVTMETEKDYLDMKKKVEEIKKLRAQTVAATIGMREAHRTLLQNLQVKKKLKDVIAALQQLYEQVHEARETIKELRSIDK